MNLLEVLKALDENPDDVYTDDNGHAKAEIRINGDCYEIKCVGSVIININKTFKKVQQPVTWQQAIEAWAVHGKDICCKLGSDTTYYKGTKSLKTSEYTVFQDQDEIGFSVNEIVKGKWYIEN